MSGPLFRPGNDLRLNACLTYGSDNWLFYAEGYRTAAELLTAFVRHEHRKQDLLIYPVIYLWRHHIELKLKSIGRAAAALLGHPWRPPKGHDLSQLLGQAQQLVYDAYAQAGEKGPSAQMRKLKSALAHFAKIDGESMVFRCPEDLQGREHLPAVTHLNFDSVEAFFHELAVILDEVENALSIFQEWKRDAGSAY